jgi:hypothetical protein
MKIIYATLLLVAASVAASGQSDFSKQTEALDSAKFSGSQAWSFLSRRLDSSVARSIQRSMRAFSFS